MNRAIAALIVATICLCGCGRRAGMTLDDAAARYVQLALAVGARDPDSLDSYAGPAARRADAERAYRPLTEVRRGLVVLDADLGRVRGDEARRRFLRGQVAALVARIDILRGARSAFDDEARQLFDFSVGALDLAAARTARATLGDRLPPGAGDLRSRYVAYRRAHLVAPDQLTRSFERALATCRERTRAHLELPPDENVAVEYAASESPWPAYTRYVGGHRSVIQVNAAFAFTGDDLRDLACHEGYPGHHTASVLQDDEFVRREHRIEFTITPLFSPQALLSEAAASYAPALAYPEREAGLQGLVEELDPLRLDIARRYLDGDLEFARAAAALEAETLVPTAAPTLKFLNEFRTYVVTYTAGRAAVARIVEAAAPGDARWQAFRRLLLAGTLAAPLP